MNNQLFKGYNHIGISYNSETGSEDTSSHCLCYDQNNSTMISYYAILEPGTCYTINTHIKDEEGVRQIPKCFRVGISDYNLLNFEQECFKSGLGTLFKYNMFTQSAILDGHDEPYTFTTNNNVQYLICQISGEGEKDLPVMLNLGNWAYENYSEPEILLPTMWYRHVNSIGGYESKILPKLQLQGCAAQAQELKSVKFPDSCKSLGRYSFRNTQVYDAVLPEDCTYYRTTFPDYCRVVGGQLLEAYPRDRIISTENDYLISTESDYLVSEGGDY